MSHHNLRWREAGRNAAAGEISIFPRKELYLFSNIFTNLWLSLQKFALCEFREVSLQILKEMCFDQMLPTDDYIHTQKITTTNNKQEQQKPKKPLISCVKPKILRIAVSVGYLGGSVSSS